MAAPPPQSLQEFLHTVPAPIVSVLVSLGSPIRRLRRLLEVVSWRVSYSNSWLALAAWWAVCLGTSVAIRYALPILLAAIFAWRTWIRPPKPPPPVTEQTLQSSVTDLTTITALFPRAPTPPTLPFPLPPLTPLVLSRAALLLTLPYILLTYFVRLRILLGIAGSILLTYRAPWALSARRILWSSAHLRWALYRGFALLTGTPYNTTPTLRALAEAGKTAAVSTTNAQSEKDPGNEKDLERAPPTRFLFTVHENQRWWMGLDWTSALLPGERPSWCAPGLQSAPPPAAFSLPSPTIALLPATKADGSPDPSARIRRTARWAWDEPEWRLSIRAHGAGSAARVERTPPSLSEEKESTASGIASSGSRLFAKMREASISERAPDAPANGTERSGSGKDGAAAATHDGKADDLETDPDGWIYADNKWEGFSGRGGMGKYTRFRRWTRVAVLTEEVERVGPGETGVVRRESAELASPTTTDHVQGDNEGVGSHALRQRLKAAVKANQ